ncbi:MAG: DNA polymerase alpha subunit B [Streblomastix strix]|uniref:DNA polymerase alpha subunit B n=1 Tax=Streblomastix strix TaxID=222440 RepID=A0A5J4VKK8_9EUKA|nr:MAG: DNA polymerase alpha subunit B [Streblomastix strix]
MNNLQEFLASLASGEQPPERPTPKSTAAFDRNTKKKDIATIKTPASNQRDYSNYNESVKILESYHKNIQAELQSPAILPVGRRLKALQLMIMPTSHAALASSLKTRQEEISNAMISLNPNIAKNRAQVGSVTHSAKTFIGRICSELSQSGRLEPSDIMLEDLAGSRIPLKFNKDVEYSVFPGQIVAVNGTNPTGDAINVSDIIEGVFPPPSNTDEDERQNNSAPILNGCSILVIQGPFWPLLSQDQLDQMEQKKKNKMDKDMGPFIDSTDSYAQEVVFTGQLTNEEIMDEMFRGIVRTAIEMGHTRFILIPSTRDQGYIRSSPVIPILPYDISLLRIVQQINGFGQIQGNTQQSSFNSMFSSQSQSQSSSAVMSPLMDRTNNPLSYIGIISGSQTPNQQKIQANSEKIKRDMEIARQTVFLSPSPSFIDIDGLNIIAFPEDVLFHINKVQCKYLKNVDIFTNLCSHLLKQRSVYPLYPAFNPSWASTLRSQQYQSQSNQSQQSSRPQTPQQTRTPNAQQIQQNSQQTPPQSQSPSPSNSNSSSPIPNTPPLQQGDEDEDQNGILTHYEKEEITSFAVEQIQRPALRILETPHLFIVPSVVKPFVREVNGCVFVNPGSFKNSRRFGQVIVAPFRKYNENLINNIDSEVQTIETEEAKSRLLSAMVKDGENEDKEKELEDKEKREKEKAKQEREAKERIRVDLCQFK